MHTVVYSNRCLHCILLSVLVVMVNGLEGVVGREQTHSTICLEIIQVYIGLLLSLFNKIRISPSCFRPTRVIAGARHIILHVKLLVLPVRLR